MIGVIALVILAIAVVVGIFVAWMSWKRKKEGKPQEANYRAFFIMGIIWVPFSIGLMVVSFILQIPFYIVFPIFALGVIYLIIGLTNRDRWQKNR